MGVGITPKIFSCSRSCNSMHSNMHTNPIDYNIQPQNRIGLTI